MPDGLDQAAAAAERYRGLAAIESLNSTQQEAYRKAQAAADRFAAAADGSFPAGEETDSTAWAWVVVLGLGLTLAFASSRR